MWLSCVPLDLASTIGEVLGTNRKQENEHDCCAVAILEEDTCCVVGHLLCLISRECYFFLRMGGTITAEVRNRTMTPFQPPQRRLRNPMHPNNSPQRGGY